MLRFANSEYLYALFLVPAFLISFMILGYWKKRALRRFGDMKIIGQLMPSMSANRSIFKFVLLMISYIFLVIAVADPQVGSKLEKVKRRGADLMIALDVSNSMLAQDISPDRLNRAKQAISKLIDNLKGDRIGIVIFAGKAYMQLPITTDYAAAKMFLSTISTESVPTQGTAISDAIDLAATSFREDDRSKAIIIITDGEDHEGDAVASAKKASEKGIRIFTIGMGSPEGAPIPLYNEADQQVGYKKDRQGQTIITKLDETMLQQIASAGNGSFTRASTSRDGLNKVFDEINGLEKADIETRMFSEYEDRFQYFLAISLAFLIAELFIAERKSKWASKLRLFNRPQTLQK
jgi:Ca-activated chloride channel family protein